MQPVAGVPSSCHSRTVLVTDHSVREGTVDVVHLVDVLEPEPENVARHADCKWVRKGSRKLAAAVPLESAQQVVHSPGDHLAEAIRHLAVAEGRRERGAVAPMVRLVDGQHHPAEHDRLRIAGHVDDKACRVHHHFVEELLACDEPHALFGKPRDRLALAKAAEERRVVISLQICEP